jgi:hypothetical protein
MPREISLDISRLLKPRKLKAGGSSEYSWADYSKEA